MQAGCTGTALVSLASRVDLTGRLTDDATFSTSTSSDSAANSVRPAQQRRPTVPFPPPASTCIHATASHRIGLGSGPTDRQDLGEQMLRFRALGERRTWALVMVTTTIDKEKFRIRCSRKQGLYPDFAPTTSSGCSLFHHCRAAHDQ